MVAQKKKSNKTTSKRKKTKKKKDGYKWNKNVKALFLKKLAEGLRVCDAAKAIKMDRTYLHRLRKKDEQFDKEWEEAVEIGNIAIEDEMVRRAFGYRKPLTHQGKRTGQWITEYSEKLLIKLAEARMEKFRPVRVLEGGKRPISMGVGLSQNLRDKIDQVYQDATNSKASD